ncbi:hypothetical protein V6Z11_A02G163600 [Gossypium hirsutum]
MLELSKGVDPNSSGLRCTRTTWATRNVQTGRT